MVDVTTTNAAVTVAAGNSELLGTIILCGIMGVVGQGIRAAVGLKSAATLEANNPSQQSVFNAAYLLFSLMLGFIIGIVAGFSLNPSLSGSMDVKTLLGLLAAGYAGTDFIENLFTTILPGVGGSTSNSYNNTGTPKNQSSRENAQTQNTENGNNKTQLSDLALADLHGRVQGLADIFNKANAPQRFVGFDISGPLKTTTLAALQNIGFTTAGAYLTFPVRLNDSNPRERGWAKLCPYLRSKGWGLIPIAFGYNNSTETGAKNDHGILLSDDPAFANAKSGQRHGQFICKLMNSSELPLNSIVYIDVESADVSDAYENYLRALFDSIKANGYCPGVYCHRQNQKARALTEYQYLIHWKSQFGQLNFEDISASLENAFYDPASVVTQVLADKKPFFWKGVQQNLEDNDIDIDICAVRDPSDKASVDSYFGIKN